MKLQAENRFTVTRELFLEGMLLVSRDSYGKYAAKCMLVFVAIWAALLIFTLSTGGSMGSILFSLGVVVLIGIWICIWTPWNHARKAWKAQQSKYGDSMKRITQFYDDHLEIRGDCPEKTVTYDNIKEIKESKNLILLVCYDKMGILLSQTGFTQGNVDIVRELIEKARA
jgi:hypothetical protein